MKNIISPINLKGLCSTYAGAVELSDKIQSLQAENAALVEALGKALDLVLVPDHEWDDETDAKLIKLQELFKAKP